MTLIESRLISKVNSRGLAALSEAWAGIKQITFEIVATEVEFLRNIDWEAGDRARRDLVQRGLLLGSAMQ